MNFGSTNRWVKKYGWRALVAVFFFYLLRDLTLYLLLPYLLLKGILS